VVQNGNLILSSGYGFADREKNIQNTSQTRFPICSLTKQFTALAILMLQEQGKLNVQDGICRYLTECPETWEPITIHQLLTHTSGIPDLFEDYWIPDSNGMGYGYGWVIGPCNQPQMVGYEGSAYGYRSIIRRYLDDHITIAILINQENIGPNIMSDLIVGKLLEEE